MPVGASVRARLITIPISHYGERARWALDHAGIAYEEEHQLQMFSWLAAMRHGGRKFLPVLLIDHGPADTNGHAMAAPAQRTVLNDSRQILSWASERAAAPLFPKEAKERAQVEALSDELAGAFGVASRLCGYEWFFRALDDVLPFNAGRAPGYQREVLSKARRPIRAFAARYLGATSERAREARAVVDRTMDAMARRLADGRPFLCGDRFSAADLTFAAMSGPNLLPARYGTPLPPLELVPADAAEHIRAWRAHPAGAFALRLYAERPPSRARYVT